MCKRVDRKGRRGSGGIPSVCVLYIEQRRSDTYRVLVGRKSREGGKAKGGGGRMDGPREEAFGVHSGGTTQQCGGLRDGERGGGCRMREHTLNSAEPPRDQWVRGWWCPGWGLPEKGMRQAIKIV